jgi:hypothetical protein
VHGENGEQRGDGGGDDLWLLSHRALVVGVGR